MKIKQVASYDPKDPLVLRIEWSDGVTSLYDFDLLKIEIQAQTLFHGGKQKLCDAHASVYKETGSIEECRKATDAVWANLLAGEFNSDRTGSPWIIECLSDLYNVEESEAAEIFGAMDKATKATALADVDVVKWKAERDVARAEARTVESKVDWKSLFTRKTA